MADFTSRLAQQFGGKSLQDWITETASKYGLPADLFQRQIQQESGFNPTAQSPVGAQGLAQLMPETAKQLGVTDPFDVGQNLDAGAKYLKQMYDKFGDWNWALAAYNAGPGRAERWKNQGLDLANLPYQETRNYVQRIGSSLTPQQAAKTQPVTEAGSQVEDPKDLLARVFGLHQQEQAPSLPPPPVSEADLTNKWNPAYDQGPLDTFLRASHIGPIADKAVEYGNAAMAYPGHLVDQAAQLAGYANRGEVLKQNPLLESAIPGGVVLTAADKLGQYATEQGHPAVGQFASNLADVGRNTMTDPLMLGMIATGGAPAAAPVMKLLGPVMQGLLAHGSIQQAMDLYSEYQQNGTSPEFGAKLGQLAGNLGLIAGLEAPKIMGARSAAEAARAADAADAAKYPRGNFDETFPEPPHMQPFEETFPEQGQTLTPSPVPDRAAINLPQGQPDFAEDLTAPPTQQAEPYAGAGAAEEALRQIQADRNVEGAQQAQELLGGQPPILPEPPAQTPYVPQGKAKRGKFKLTPPPTPAEQLPLDMQPDVTAFQRSLRERTQRQRRIPEADVAEQRFRAEEEARRAAEADRLEREGMQTGEGDTSFEPPPDTTFEPPAKPMENAPLAADRLEAERQARMNEAPSHEEVAASTVPTRPERFEYRAVRDGVNPKKVWHRVVGLNAAGDEVTAQTYRSKKEATAALKRAQNLQPPPIQAGPKAKQTKMFGGEMLDTTTPIRPEDAFAESPLFTQERDKAAREQAKSQKSLFPEEEPQKGPQAEVKDTSFFSRLPGRKARMQAIADRMAVGFDRVKNAVIEKLADRFKDNPAYVQALKNTGFGLDLDTQQSAYNIPAAGIAKVGGEGPYRNGKVYAGADMNSWRNHVVEKLLDIDGAFRNADDFATGMRARGTEYPQGEYVHDVDTVFDYWKNDFQRGADGNFHLKPDVTPEYIKAKASALLMAHELLHTGSYDPGAMTKHGAENAGPRTERAKQLVDENFREYLRTAEKPSPEQTLRMYQRILKDVEEIYPGEVRVTSAAQDALELRGGVTHNPLAGEHEQIMAGVAPQLSDLAEMLNLKNPNVQKLFSPNTEETAPLPGMPEGGQGGGLVPPPTAAAAQAPTNPAHPLGKKFNWLLEMVNIPRAIATAGDLSGVLRQGIVGFARHPIMSTKNLAESLQTLKGQKGINYFLAQESAMKGTPLFDIYKKAGGVFSDFDTLPEDAYYGSKKIREFFRKNNIQGWDPVFASERVFTLFLNKMRVDMFNDYYNKMRSAGIDGVDASGDPTSATKQLVKAINIATGHGGQLGEGAVGQVLKGSHSLLNTVFYSPSMIRSRFHLLNTAVNPLEWRNIYNGYAENSPSRANAMKMALMINAAPIASYAALVGGMTAAGAMALGGTVEKDPKSSDFMQIRKGSTRIDLTGGVRPYIVAGMRLLTGQTKPEYSEAKDQSRWKTIDAFARSRYSPVLSTFRNAMDNSSYSGQDFWGPWKDVINGEEPMTPEMAKELVSQTGGMLSDMAMPMFFRDMYEAYQEDPVTTAAVALPAFLGVGLNTHDIAPGIDKDLYEAMHEGQMSPFSALKSAKIPGMKDWEGKDVQARVPWLEQQKIEQGFDKNVYEALSDLTKRPEFKSASPLAKHLILRVVMTNMAGIRTKIAPGFVPPPSLDRAVKQAGEISPSLLEE